ncbi:MAG: hypothetical protein JWM80_5333 [Cyanobacteria bacterium RYN_339]|nr:hypothetical protein [Cyanobacteria bacterium RYN_339]
MSADERDYLADFKASLDEAWRGFWLTAGLWGLPAGFLMSSVSPAHGGDRLAIAMAAAIIVAFIGAIISYSPQGGKTRRLALSDLKQPGRLEEDLLAREVEEAYVTITGRKMQGAKKRDERAPRRFFVQAAGRTFEVTPLRYMSLVEGKEVEFTYAPASNMLLAVDGLRERLPMLTTRRNEARREREESEGGSFQP